MRLSIWPISFPPSKRRSKNTKSESSPIQQHRRSPLLPATLLQRTLRSNLRMARVLFASIASIFPLPRKKGNRKTHPHPAPDSPPKSPTHARPVPIHQHHRLQRRRDKTRDEPDPKHVEGYTTSNSTPTDSVPRRLLRLSVRRRLITSDSVRRRHLPPHPRSASAGEREKKMEGDVPRTSLRFVL